MTNYSDIDASLRRFRSTGVISAEEMQRIDRNADEFGITARERMEAAGLQLANAIRLDLPKTVLFVCGPGNNGGDGYVAARHLAEDTHVFVLSVGARTPEAKAALNALTGTSAYVHHVEQIEDLPEIFDTVVIVDCLLGTGARTPLSEFYAAIVELINNSASMVIACDVPTPTARADKVIAFHAAKRDNSEVKEIGIPFAAEICCGPGDLLALTRKKADSHKGDGGKVLVIGGGPYQGAPFLAAEAALRGGADIVKVAAPVDGFAPDIILERLSGSSIGSEHIPKLMAMAAEADVVVAGPGLGSSEEALDAVRYAVSNADYAVVDADALRAPLPRAKIATIYTPHSGEFSRVFGIALDSNVPLAERALIVSHGAEQVSSVVLFKGKTDIISDGKKVRFNTSGDAAMTVGGTGDVLAGLCAGIFCRIHNPMKVASIASYAAGKAGEMVAEIMGDGMTASDLLQGIATVLWRK